MANDHAPRHPMRQPSVLVVLVAVSIPLIGGLYVFWWRVVAPLLWVDTEAQKVAVEATAVLFALALWALMLSIFLLLAGRWYEREVLKYLDRLIPGAALRYLNSLAELDDRAFCWNPVSPANFLLVNHLFVAAYYRQAAAAVRQYLSKFEKQLSQEMGPNYVRSLEKQQANAGILLNEIETLLLNGAVHNLVGAFPKWEADSQAPLNFDELLSKGLQISEGFLRRVQRPLCSQTADQNIAECLIRKAADEVANIILELDGYMGDAKNLEQGAKKRLRSHRDIVSDLWRHCRAVHVA